MADNLCKYLSKTLQIISKNKKNYEEYNNKELQNREYDQLRKRARKF